MKYPFELEVFQMNSEGELTRVWHAPFKTKEEMIDSAIDHCGRGVGYTVNLIENKDYKENSIKFKLRFLFDRLTTSQFCELGLDPWCLSMGANPDGLVNVPVSKVISLGLIAENQVEFALALQS